MTIGQFFSVQGGHHATKHVFAGTERIASKLIPVAEQVALWQGGDDPTSANTLPCRTARAVAADGCRMATVPARPSQAQGALRDETYYYHPDHLGSTSWMTDHAGRVHEHVEYYPYGEVWRDSRLDDDPGPQARTPAYLFTSKEYDPETRLYYFGARYYDPARARWMSQDPALYSYTRDAESAQGLSPVNLSSYTYTWNSPVVLRDPTGKFPVHRYPWSPDNLATHQRITSDALSGVMSAVALRQVIDSNVRVDKDQGIAPTSQAKHAMRNENQSVENAKAMREQLVREKMSEAAKDIREGKVSEARAAFGEATHGRQDHSATAHTNDHDEPMVWRGLAHPVDAKRHIDIDMAERIEGVHAQRAVTQTRQMFDQLCTDVLGENPSPEAERQWGAFTGANSRPLSIGNPFRGEQ